MKKLETYSEAVETVGSSEQVALRGNSTENKMRMRAVGGDEVTGSLDGRVSGLHDDLCRGKIPPDENVKVFDLGKGRGHAVLALVATSNLLPNHTRAIVGDSRGCHLEQFVSAWPSEVSSLPAW